MSIKITPPKHHTHESPFMALALETDRPRIAYLGVESGGRSRRHIDTNLLVPGLGGQPANLAASPVTGAPRAYGEGIQWRSLPVQGGGELTWSIKIINDRQFEVRIKPQNTTRRMAFDWYLNPVPAPPTLWSAQTRFPTNPSPNQSPTPPYAPWKNQYGIPLLIHFPDFGFLRVEGDADIVCREHWHASAAHSGLTLGLHNQGGHVRMHAYHHGHVHLRFAAKTPDTPLRLRFTVADEFHPSVPDAPEWNGLRRCWANSFTLHRRTMTMGDNPALNGVAHLAIHFKSEMCAHSPPLLPGLSLAQPLGRALDLGFKNAQAATGEINWVHHNQSAPAGTFIDTTPANLLALYDYTVATADWSLFLRHLDPVRRAVDFLLRLESQANDGMLELPYHGNFFDENDPHRTRNWWDNFGFGHRDACFMLLCHRALHGVETLMAKSGNRPEAERIAAWRSRFARHFHRVFYVPATRRYAGWISQDGRAHDYAFTFIQAMGINEGIIPLARGRAILKRMLRQMAQQGYDGRHGVPGNLEPSAPADTIDWPLLGAWGVYENGGCSGMAAGHFLKALYRVNLRSEADRLFFAMLNTFEIAPTHNGLMPGYAKSIDWRTKEGLPCGYNYLADNYYFLAAAIPRLNLRTPKLVSP